MILSTITNGLAKVKNCFGSIKWEKRVKNPCKLNPCAECPNKLIYENGGMRREAEGISNCCQTFYDRKRSAEIESQLQPNTDYNGFSFTKGYLASVKKTWQRIKDVDYRGPTNDPKYRVQKLDIDMTKNDKKSDIETVQHFLDSMLVGHNLDYLDIHDDSIEDVGLDAINIRYIKNEKDNNTLIGTVSISKIYFSDTIDAVINAYLQRKDTIDNIIKLKYGKHADDLILLLDLLNDHANVELK